MNDYIFDYRLGYIRGGCDMQGFDIIGESTAPMGKIVTLGGYTTPEQARNKTTWADSLHNFSDSKLQILNGCTDGYTSAQILTMFIREVILFRPKLVVCLSGFYNIAYKYGFAQNKQDAEILKNHPFATPRQLAFYRKITSRFGLGYDEVYYGEENNLTAWSCWLKQMEMIDCLCAEFGIKLISFLQPCIFSGNYRRSEQENTFLREQYGLTDTDIEDFCGVFKQEYENIANHAKNIGYIQNISDLFGDESDIYLNPCRVRDEFTSKIAEAIYSCVRDEVKAL